MKPIDKLTAKEIIQKYEDIKEEIRIKTEELKIYKKHVYDIVWEANDEQLSTSNNLFKIQYKPKWKFTDELEAQEKDYKQEIKILKMEEIHAKLAQQISAGGYLVMKPKITLQHIH